MFVIIDGSAILNTGYYGTIPKEMYTETDPEKLEILYKDIKQNEDGVYTNALHFLLSTVFKILKTQHPSHICVVLDKDRDTFRRKMYSDYKGNRTQTQYPLKQQIKTAQVLLSEIGVQTLVTDGFEADDIAGTLAKEFETQEEVILLTKDKDYLQLISDNTSVWLMQQSQEKADLVNMQLNKEYKTLPDKCVLVNKTNFQAYTGLKFPDQIVDLKGLAGDSSDNIPGCPSVGPTTATKLLNYFDSIDDLYKTILSITREEAKDLFKTEANITRLPYDSLVKNKHLVYLSKDLAKIYTNVLIDTDINSYKAVIHKNALIDWLDILELDDLKETFVK